MNKCQTPSTHIVPEARIVNGKRYLSIRFSDAAPRFRWNGLRLARSAVMAALFVSTMALAGTFTKPFRVTFIEVGYTDGSVVVAGSTDNPAECEWSSIKFNPSTSNAAAVQEIATVSFLTGKEVRCEVDGCDGNFQSGRKCFIND